ncbi:MAG: SDR family oxidoreductase [Verrucomicrobiota bacterium]
MKGVAGQRVLITGGCGDIGTAVARRFLEQGASVVLADLRDTRQLDAPYVHCDVTDAGSVTAAVAFTVDRLGGLDVGIANAGMVANAPLLDAKLEDFQRTLAVNLTGSMLVAQAVARVLVQNPPSATGHRGTILFTGSWVQTMPWPGGTAYCASKGGQEMLMKVAAQELAAHGITCNIVAPGFVYAGLTKGIYDRDATFRGRVDSTVPLGRMSTAEEVAGAFVFLASTDGNYVTGTTLVVDGGASLVKR